MKSLFFAILGWVCLMGVTLGKDRFASASEHYEAGDFKAAAEEYEGLLEDGPRVSVLQNLGSCYFRMEDYGRAILAFERALLLDSGDPDLRANLKLAQDAAAIFPVDGGGGWKSLASRFSRKQWALLALTFAVLCPLVVLGGVLLRKKASTVPYAAGAVSGVVVLVVMISIYALRIRKDESGRAVVIGNPATVRISPFDSAEERASLASGREVMVGKEERGYFWVTSENGGTEGWISVGEVERIIPE